MTAKKAAKPPANPRAELVALLLDLPAPDEGEVLRASRSTIAALISATGAEGFGAKILGVPIVFDDFLPRGEVRFTMTEPAP